MKVLVTGGAGYIGSTICSALEDAGHTPVILDSLVTGRKEFTIDKIFYHADIADLEVIERIFKEHPDIFATIHCAALIVVPESVEKPYEYYRENVNKSLEFYKKLSELGYGRVVFSSSAAVYDTVPDFMVTETSPIKPQSPYARTKVVMEMVLEDFCYAYALQGIALRYFNPIGADPKMRSGSHLETPTQVLGIMVDTAQGKKDHFQITGVNYDTRDGTGLRDYIHIWDLARAHVMAMEHFEAIFQDRSLSGKDYIVINLGTGRGVTVRELVQAFENVNGAPIKKMDTPRRPGDVAGAYANADRAKKLLGWETELSIEQGISDALKWGKVRKEILNY